MPGTASSDITVDDAAKALAKRALFVRSVPPDQDRLAKLAQNGISDALGKYWNTATDAAGKYWNKATDALGGATLRGGARDWWQGLNPYVRNAAIGAGVGGGVGLGASLLGKDEDERKNPWRSALTGSLAGAGIGAGYQALSNTDWAKRLATETETENRLGRVDKLRNKADTNMVEDAVYGTLKSPAAVGAAATGAAYGADRRARNLVRGGQVRPGRINDPAVLHRALSNIGGSINDVPHSGINAEEAARIARQVDPNTPGGLDRLRRLMEGARQGGVHERLGLGPGNLDAVLQQGLRSPSGEVPRNIHKPVTQFRNRYGPASSGVGRMADNAASASSMGRWARRARGGAIPAAAALLGYLVSRGYERRQASRALERLNIPVGDQ